MVQAPWPPMQYQIYWTAPEFGVNTDITLHPSPLHTHSSIKRVFTQGTTPLKAPLEKGQGPVDGPKVRLQTGCSSGLSHWCPTSSPAPAHPSWVPDSADCPTGMALLWGESTHTVLHYCQCTKLWILLCFTWENCQSAQLHIRAPHSPGPPSLYMESTGCTPSLNSPVKPQHHWTLTFSQAPFYFSSLLLQQQPARSFPPLASKNHWLT